MKDKKNLAVEEKLLMEKLEKIKKISASLDKSQKYSREIETLRILEELVKEQIKNEDTYCTVS